jgi:hypothetical protein
MNQPQPLVIAWNPMPDLVIIDLVDWFKNHHQQDEGYQTIINRALREYVAQRQS